MKADRYLSITVLLQMIVVIVQLLLPLLWIVSEEQAAGYRVLFSIVTYSPAILIIMRRKPNIFFVTFAVYGIVLLLNYQMFPESHVFIESSSVYSLTPIMILTALSIISIRDLDMFKKMLLYVSRLTLLLALAYTTAYQMMSLKGFQLDYNMAFGYSMLLPAMYLFVQPKTSDKLFSIAMLLLILLGGSRGPALILVLFYIVDVLFFGTVKKTWTKLPLILLGLFVLVYFSQKYIDFEESRTLSLLERGELITNDTGRGEYVYNIIKQRIFERPILGWGIGADRYFVNGSTAHNIIYELLLEYGIFGGGIIVVFFFGWIVKNYFSRSVLNQHGGREMYVIMVFYGILPLMVSSSYLIDIRFGILIGWIVATRQSSGNTLVNILYNNRYVYN